MLERASGRVETHLDRNPFLYLGLLSITYFLSVGVTAAHRPFWFDELFTFYVSKLQDTRAVWQALLDGADIHPPLDYLIRHASLKAFGESELAFRLPSIVAYWVGSVCLYAFVRRSGSAVSALTAFCFLLNTYALRFSHEGRPYALLIASACASLLAWQAASRQPTVLRLGILAGCLSVGPFVHYYGVFHYLPVIAGEILSSIRRRAVLWPIVLSLAGSFLPLVWLYPFASQAAVYKDTSLASFGVSSIFKAYPELMTEAVFPATMSLLICLVLLASRVAGGEGPHSKWSFGVPEFGAGVQLCLVPFVAYVVALHTGALTTKYVIVTAVGLAVVLACGCEFIKTRHPLCSVVILFCFGLSGVYQLGSLAQHSVTSQDFISPSLTDLVRQADSPVVFSNAHLYLQAYHYLPKQLQSRIFYLSDRMLAEHGRQGTGDDLALVLLRRAVPIQLVYYHEFIAKHSRFMVVDSGGWLTAKLLDNRLRVSLQAVTRGYRMVLVEAVM